MRQRVELICYSFKYAGDYRAMLEAYSGHEEIDIAKEYELFLKMNCGALVYTDDDYPTYFKDLEQPPLVLFYYGDRRLFRSRLRLGVIGTRHPSEVGYRAVNGPLAYCLCDFALRGEELTIVNGMARGIDMAAAYKAMEYHQKIIMVMGSGIDNIYPPSAADIYRYCQDGNGLVISEYPFEVAPLPTNFPFRNRLIAALVHGLFVPEAKLPSGTLSTVNWALNLGRFIATCPLVFDSEHRLNNELIRDGADVIVNGKDLGEYIDSIRTQYRFG